MTQQAAMAANVLYDQLFSALDDVNPEQWDWPSGCPGWRIRDVVAHLAASARQSRDPLPSMPALPPGLARERQHDYEVTRRKNWPISDVLNELKTYVPRNARTIEKLQSPELADREVELPGLGTYPSHAIANASAFDVYCHLYLDIAPTLGLPAPPDQPDEIVIPVIEWMMWGLPQMQGDLLAATVTAPITLRLTGPGESTWTVRRVVPGTSIETVEADEGDVKVTSRALDFVSWGTKRSDWQPACEIDGDRALAAEFLGTLNII